MIVALVDALGNIARFFYFMDSATTAS